MTVNDDTTAAQSPTQDCGLLLNPLVLATDPAATKMFTQKLAAHAMTNRLLTTVRRSAATQKGKPITRASGRITPDW
ncbi:MAG: hypothetical protein WCI74_21400, partial [Actinomycetes bacterium]